MKLAILGHSPLALEAALRFHLHGAALTWFVDKNDFSQFSSAHFDRAAFTTDVGHSVLLESGRRYHPETFSWKEWQSDYQDPLIQYLKAHQEVKFDEVISVTKRFLAPQEEIEGRSRFLDLFRLIYHVNPKEFIEAQKESNPDTYERLTEEFVNSLTSKVEMYQDYDLVLDFRNSLAKSSAAVSGRALGEGRVSDKVFYASEALKRAAEIKIDPSLREMALIGSEALSAEILISLEAWLRDERSRLFIVTTEEEPFKKFLDLAHPDTAKKLLAIFGDIEREFEKDVEVFSKKLREWQELDDFVQVKIPKPVEPIPRLNFFSGHNVTAIDELIDRKRMFLTLERPEFRQGLKHTENNFLELKTVGVDLILVSHSKKNRSIIALDKDEVGFFDLTPELPNKRGAWENDLLKLEGIEDEIFKLFSPVDSH